VAEVRRDHPEAEAWLELLEAALAESEEATWEAGVPAALADRPAKAPILFRARLAVNARAAERWVRRIAGRQVDAGALLEAAVCQDDVRIEALAATAGAEPEALRVAAQMAAVPLLQACGRAFAPQLAPTWWEGYCPVCGAWPTLTESVGLERKRQEFEIEQAKRETTVAVREENLKADKDRFAEQLKFHEDRFATEVGYLKDMMGQLMERLPTAEIKIARRA